MNLASEPASTQDTHRDLSTNVLEGKGCVLKSDLTDAGIEKKKPGGSQVAERIRAFYTSGVPFFTKEAIADLAGQLHRARKQFQDEGGPEGRKKGGRRLQMLTLKALDGKTVRVDNELGAVLYGDASEDIAVDFVIQYQVYQHLILIDKENPDDYIDELAYCPLQVFYHTRSRRTDTKELRAAPKCKPLETIKMAFRSGLKAWEDSEECKKLTNALMTNPFPDKVTKIIAFACGSMPGFRGHEESILQHALILTIKELIQKTNFAADREIKCYAQDPAYTEVDRTVLAGAGIQILDDPYGFLEVDDSSVVISFGSNVPVRQIVADIARPAIMIWDKVRPEEEIEYWSKGLKGMTHGRVEELEGDSTDPESPRLREMIQNQYTEIHDLSGNTFGNSCVYVRKCSVT